MVLALDCGNTQLKLGVFAGQQMITRQMIAYGEVLSALQELQMAYPELQQAILSSVGRIPVEIQQYLRVTYETTTVDRHMKFPFTSRYKTPETLGTDRMVLAASACYQYPGQNVLIIDAGTCITYDFKTETETYLGGAIAPGLQLRYKSLNDHTANLPLLIPSFPQSVVGRSTEESIHSGVLMGTVFEIEGVIQHYCNSYGSVVVILTGGDGEFLAKRLKSTIFANSNFLLEGLNYLLAFNT